MQKYLATQPACYWKCIQSLVVIIVCMLHTFETYGSYYENCIYIVVLLFVFICVECDLVQYAGL